MNDGEQNNEKKLDLSARVWIKPEQKTVPISIRDVTQSDVNFIFNSWLKSFRAGRLASKVDNSVYYAEQHKVIEKLIANGTTHIACDPNEPGEIYGYVNYQMIDGVFVMHYIYTKHTFRNMGIARQLLKHIKHDFKTAACCSHLSPAAEKLHAKYNLVYHPYILINYNEADKHE